MDGGHGPPGRGGGEGGDGPSENRKTLHLGRDGNEQQRNRNRNDNRMNVFGDTREAPVLVFLFFLAFLHWYQTHFNECTC